MRTRLTLTVAAACLMMTGAAVAAPKIDISAVAKTDRDNGLPKNWNTSATFIEIFVRSYQDSNGDGIGDFKGLTSRLDYLQSLGVTGIWLMPMNPSADNDHGYAVSDYRGVHSDYGSMSDFETFLAEAHKRGIGVIIDYVINHSANDNPIYLSAAKSKSSPYRDWYIFANENPKWPGNEHNWRKNLVGEGYFYGLFDDKMPDFNLKNQKVIDYHADNFRFWLNKGVDGFRIDAVTMLVENGPTAFMDQPENVEVLKQVNAVIKSYPNRYLICEASEKPAMYAGEACTNSFAFGTEKVVKETARTGKLSEKLVKQLQSPLRPQMPLVLQSHDSYVGDRLIHDLGEGGAYRVAAAISVLASDTPFSYYGEEIGIANNGKYDDPGLRTPMSWSAVTGHGFTTAAKPYRAYALNAKSHNVVTQTGVAGSLIEYYRALYLSRSCYPVLADGTFALQSKAGDDHLIFTRAKNGSEGVVIMNLSDQRKTLTAKVADGVYEGALKLGEPVQLTATGGVLTVTLPAKAVAAYVRSEK